MLAKGDTGLVMHLQTRAKAFFWKRLSILLIVVIGSLFVYSCKGDSARLYEDQEASAESMNASELRKVRVSTKWAHQAQFAGLYVAKDKGYYLRRGLDVEIVQGGLSSPPMAMLDSGEVDFAQLHLLTVLSTDPKGKPYVNIAQISQKAALMLVAQKSRGFHNLQDLKYKRLGLWKDDYLTLPMIFVEKNQLDMEIVPIDDTISLFLKGYIDAMSAMRYNELHKLYQAGIEFEDLLMLDMSSMGLDVVEDGLYCTKEFYQENQLLCKDFAQATMEGWLYAVNHREESLDVIMNLMNENKIVANRPHQRWMLEEMRKIVLAKPGVFGFLDQESYDFATELLREYKIPNYYPDYKDFCPNAE